jgi:uracil-DNA glycosylase family 4
LASTSCLAACFARTDAPHSVGRWLTPPPETLLEQILKTVSETDGCQGCPLARLYPSNTFVAPSIGPGTTLIVAEAPGAQEAERGEPLIGPTGGWLRGRFDEERQQWAGGLLGRAGIKDSECSRLNVIQCRPPENKFPTSAEALSYISNQEANAAVSQCLRNHVRPVLDGRPWRRVILLGEKALRYLTGKSEGIKTWRGSPLALVDSAGNLEEEPRAVATFHPAWIARDQRFIPAVVSDLKKSMVLPPENYSVHPDISEVRAFTATSFAFDIETIRETGQITMVGLCDRQFHAICVPWGGEYTRELKRIFHNAEEVTGHNCLQFDLPALREQGVQIVPGTRVWDTMLLQHLCQPDLPHDLGFLGSIFTNKPAWKHLSGDDEALYCCRDVDVTFQCAQQLKPIIRSLELMDLYEQVQVPLARLCRQMHETGITIDPNRIGVVRENLLKEMALDETKLPESLRTRTQAIRRRVAAPEGTLGKSGKPVKFVLVDDSEQVVPWRSPAVIADYLYTELALPAQLHPKTKQISTGKVALDWLAKRLARGDYDKKLPNAREATAAVQALRRLRIADEMITTFAQEKMLYVSRLHPHFNVHGTRFGRLSSSDPNLQNIPLAAKFIYVPSRPDWCFLEMDFSGLENRLTSWYANDTERLARLAVAGFNEHKWVASKFFNIPYEEVTKDNDPDSPYHKGKTINHGCDGGMGPRKIANMEDMDFSEVNRLVKLWRQLNAKTVAAQENTGKLAKEQGYLKNAFGRRDWFYTDNYFTEANRFYAQSTGADILYRTLLGLLFERLDISEDEIRRIVHVYRPLPEPVRCLITVHDSMLFEGPAEALELARPLIQEVATQPWPELRSFQIPVEFKQGPAGASWGELEAVH